MKNILYTNSFASHPKAKYWSNKNEGQPEDFSLNSHKKIWFDCSECGHTFDTSLLNINQLNNWCPYCYNRKLCGNCQDCNNKSFASHPMAINWSDKNKLKPKEVLKGSGKMYYFNCNECLHEICMSLKNISSKGRWCSYCSHQKLCNKNDCNMCYNNSFASVERSKYLNDKTNNPRHIFKSTNKKYKFNCNKCDNSFDKMISDVTRGIWCPFCINKTEEILYNKLSNYYTIKRQYKPTWCKNPNTHKFLPYDYVLEELKIIIELDGPQHFKQIGKWQSPELTKVNDIYKIKCANDNGFSVIRILQKDVWYNKYDWLKDIQDNISNICEQNIIQNIYICKNDEYKNFEII